MFTNSLTIETHRDFEQIRLGNILQYHKFNFFEWESTDGTIVGSLESDQESIYCVYVNIYVVQHGKVIYHYVSCSRFTRDVQIQWYDESDETFYEAQFYDNKLDYFTKIDSIEYPEEILSNMILIDNCDLGK